MILGVVGEFSIFGFCSFWVLRGFSLYSLCFSLSPLMCIEKFMIARRSPLVFGDVNF